MGLLSFLSNKKDKVKAKGDNSNHQKQKDSFVLGVRDAYKLKDSNDLVVVGILKGKVSVGDAVYCSNPGDDDDELFLSVVLGIEIGPNKPVNSASECQVGIKIENGGNAKIKTGTVLYTRDKLAGEVHDEYIAALGDTYVMDKDLVMTEEEINSRSLTDLAEIWRLFNWYHSEVKKDESEHIKAENREKINRIASVICKKILSSEEIYCVFSKATGEPYMYSRTIKRDAGYMCTPPDIVIFTKAYKSVMTEYYEKQGLEIKKIENGKNGDGIYNFLGDTFYLNGAYGVGVLSLSTAIDASMLVEKPDYSKTKQIEIPVTNPDIERWLLLMGQMNEPVSEDEKLIYNLYYGFMAKEMVKGKFLIPMQGDKDDLKPDENGKTILKKDTTIKLPTRDGKYGRGSLCMFTDWKRFRMVYNEEWGGLIQPISGMIDIFDCEINPTSFVKAGCYIGKEMYEDMERISGKTNDK